MSFSTGLRTQIHDMVSIPRFSSGILKVWSRNFLFFRYKWFAASFWSLFEPILYLIAIGLGLGQFVGQIDGVPYLEWFFPGLIASTAMLVSFFETTYGSFSKLIQQKTYSAVLFTPVSPHDVVLGEILWATTKGMIGAVGVGAIGSIVVGITLSGALPSLPILLLLCWVFASLGVLFTSFASHQDSCIFAQSAFIMPMYLFCGTYFPISKLPHWAQVLAWGLPLTHGVMPVRSLLLGEIAPLSALNMGVLFAMAWFITNWAVARLHRKLTV